MWGDEDYSLSHTKGSDSLDLDRHFKMFRPSSRSSSPFSLTDLDLWDTRSRFTAQTSAWCGMATVSGTRFLSKNSTSTSGSSGDFRQNDPGLRKWQSLSHLAPEGATRSFPPCPGAELRAARDESSFRQAEVEQSLQDAHERLDTQLDRLRTTNSQLSYNITTAKLLDIKQKQLSEAMSALEAAELSQFEKSQQHGETYEKVLQLEKDLLQMRSTLDRGSNNRPTKRTLGSLSQTLPMSQQDFNRKEEHKVDTELYNLTGALRDVEERAKTQEEERNQALQKLQTSTETQRALLNQIDDLNQRLSLTRQNHSEVQEQLREANNKISEACLEKAIFSTQVLKLEDEIKELKAKWTGPLSDKDHMIQEKADLHQRVQVLELQLKRQTQQVSEGCEVHVIQTDTESHNNKQDQETSLLKEESKALKEVNEKLAGELEIIQQRMTTSQSQLQEMKEEMLNSSKQITDLEAECSQLIREKEELLSKMNEGRHELTDMRKKFGQLRESVEVLQLEKLKLQDQCLSLEAEVLEKEEKLHLQEEEYRKQDAVGVQNMEELQAVASHWTEKWQKVALTLQSTQEELEKLKTNNSRNELQAEVVHLAREIEKLKKEGQKDKEEIENLLQHKANMEAVLTRAKKESDSLLRVELDACKQELELERSRSQSLLHSYRDKGGKAVQTQDKQTVTGLSSLLSETPSDSQSSPNKSQQGQDVPPSQNFSTFQNVCIQSSEVQRLKQKLSEEEKELREKEEALKSIERLRELERNETKVKTSALKLKASEGGQDDGGRADVSITDSLRPQLEESRRRTEQLQQEKTLALQKIQTLRQLCPVKDEKPSVEGGKDKNVCPVFPETEQQRRMVTDQLKSLFKEREGKEVAKADNRSAAAQTGAQTSSLQDWNPTSKVVWSAVDRRRWKQPGSGLMPVFEEDEESSNWPEGEDHAEEILHNQCQQMSTTSAVISSLNAKIENRLQDTLKGKQPIQDCPPTAKNLSDTSSGVEVLNPSRCSDETELQQKRPPSLYPDGLFLAELIDICSPSEEEEEGENK